MAGRWPTYPTIPHTDESLLVRRRSYGARRGQFGPAGVTAGPPEPASARETTGHCVPASGRGRPDSVSCMPGSQAETTHAASPFLEIERDEWAALAPHAEPALTEEELGRVRGLGEPLDAREVAEVYLPLS